MPRPRGHAEHLARSTRVNLAKHDLLELVVQRQNTGTSDTTENVGTSTLEQRFGTLLGNDLRPSIKHRLVVDTSAGSHHHATTTEQISTTLNTSRETTNRIVSRGYDARPAPIVTPQPSKNDAKNEPSRDPTRTTGSAGRYQY